MEVEKRVNRISHQTFFHPVSFSAFSCKVVIYFQSDPFLLKLVLVLPCCVQLFSGRVLLFKLFFPHIFFLLLPEKSLIMRKKSFKFYFLVIINLHCFAKGKIKRIFNYETKVYDLPANDCDEPWRR